MKKKTLDLFAMPRTTTEYALQALGSARRRWLQMLPGHGPVAAPREEEVTHYVGPENEVVLGSEPDTPVEDKLRRDEL